MLGMASALETLCGQAFGARKFHMMGVYMQRSWLVLLMCAVVLLPMYFFAEEVLLLTGRPGHGPPDPKNPDRPARKKPDPTRPEEHGGRVRAMISTR